MPRMPLATWVAAAMTTMSCAHVGVAQASPSMEATASAAPDAAPLDGDADPGLMRAHVLTVGTTYALPRGPAGRRVTWEVAERDRHGVRLDGEGRMTPLVPGSLTLQATYGDRRAWFQHAVRATAPGWPELHAMNLPEGRPAFGRPVVARDAATWARLATFWTLRAVGAPVLAIRDGRVASQVTASNLDFRRDAVLVVDVTVERRFLSHPVFTHAAGNVLFLTVPASWDPAEPESLPPRFGSDREDDRFGLGGVGAYAFQIPNLPAGVRVALAPFPEAGARSWVTGEPEVDVAPLVADMAPAELLPVEIGP